MRLPCAAVWRPLLICWTMKFVCSLLYAKVVSMKLISSRKFQSTCTHSQQALLQSCGVIIHYHITISRPSFTISHKKTVAGTQTVLHKIQEVSFVNGRSFFPFSGFLSSFAFTRVKIAPQYRLPTTITNTIQYID